VTDERIEYELAYSQSMKSNDSNLNYLLIDRLTSLVSDLSTRTSLILEICDKTNFRNVYIYISQTNAIFCLEIGLEYSVEALPCKIICNCY
jgi:hypothetical protein